ncbi:MAG: ABC transporter substrate-binding protein [Anaerovibrio sp.]|uniref:ABC transporter substrate-binding protein n=1 Tax=Anaerovibrio sp. TaxID=1872532 RepID=UPI0026007440|nr:ABC transporter substrate-binding protein [Anaerovibrio sp.]MCR5177089.1 ABC transporter substrate-binding protein [Anaerovibrio sp.]
MKVICRFMVVVLLLVAVLCSGCGMTSQSSDGAYEVTDCQGTVVRFSEKPSRVVTLTMGTDNIVLGLAKPDRMIACNTNLDDPHSSNVVELARQIPNRVRHPKLEELVALQPDLVIAADWGNHDFVQSLRDMGINVLVVRGAKNLDDIRENIRLIAAALGEPEKGPQLIARMDEQLAALKDKVDRLVPQNQRKCVALISLVQNYGGKDCVFDEKCQWAGVVNGLAEAGLNRGNKLTKEMLLKINPDIILLPSFSAHGSFDNQGFKDKYLKDPSMQQIKAITDDGIREPRDAYIYASSQDFCFGAQEIAYAAYGDEFALEEQQHLSVAE